MDTTAVRPHANDRPAGVTAAASAAAPLAALTVAGALIFNLIGADRPSLYVEGGLLMLWGIGYAVGVIALLRRRSWGRVLLLALVPLHAALNIGKVTGGETFSVVFLLLIATIAVGLLAPGSADWLSSTTLPSRPR